MLALRVTFCSGLVPNRSPLLRYETRLTHGKDTVIFAIFATCITEMDDILCCGVNMSTLMFELVWGNWHNAREATGLLGELEGNACYKISTRSWVYHLRVLKAFVPPNKSRFNRLWCGRYVAYSHRLAWESTRVFLPRRMEIRNKNFGA